MAWRWSGNKPLSEPMIDSLLTHICVTRPQWVKVPPDIYRPPHTSPWRPCISWCILLVQDIRQSTLWLWCEESVAVLLCDIQNALQLEFNNRCSKVVETQPLRPVVWYYCYWWVRDLKDRPFYSRTQIEAGSGGSGHALLSTGSPCTCL